MANDLSLFPAVNHTATLEARIRRFLSVTVAHYGLVPGQSVARQVGGSLV